MKKNKKKNNNGEIDFTSKELKNIKVVNEDSKKIVAFIIALIVVLVLIALLFIFNAKYVGKDYFQKSTTTTTTEAKYDDSLLTVDSIFDVTDKEYYVLAYDESDETSAFLYSNLVSSYDNDDKKLYVIDLSSAMNKKYYDSSKDESIKAGSFNFKSATLINIKKGKIASSTSTREEIINLLSE